MFPDDFKSVKDNLVKGGVPCGCSKNPKWSEYQYQIRVQRECGKLSYVFHGWEGEFKGVRTKLDLENPKTGNRWGSGNIDRFLKGGGDPEEGNLKTKLRSTFDDSVHIKGFIKAGFTEDYKFTRNTERVNSKGYYIYWNYTCPNCSADEYVKAGVCNGVFTSHVSHLKLGKKACRCRGRYNWTQEQREYQIEKVCKGEGLTFKGWGNEKFDCDSKFQWVCSEGHECKTSVSNFLNRGRRCMACRREKQKEEGTFYGYYPKRTQESDSLYILNFDNQYIKVGRSFDIERRISELRKESGIPNIELLYTAVGTHQEIYDLEQFLHEELRDRGFEYETTWGSVECFDSDSLGLVYKMVDEEIADNSNTLKEGEW